MGGPSPADEAWLSRALSRLLATWGALEPKALTPASRPLLGVEEDVEDTYSLGQREAATLRPPPPKLPEGLSPFPSALRSIPEEPPLDPGEMRLPPLAQEWLVGAKASPSSQRTLIRDPLLVPLEPMRLLDVEDPIAKTYPRRSPPSHRGGYRWPDKTRSDLENCRRQMLLRTDLSRVTYPRIPLPGELMIPMLDADGEPTRPTYEPPERVGIAPKALVWDRVMLERQGPRRPMLSAYRSPMAQGSSPSKPPPADAPPNEGETP